MQAWNIRHNILAAGLFLVKAVSGSLQGWDKKLTVKVLISP
jgi:hypothetical protein